MDSRVRRELQRRRRRDLARPGRADDHADVDQHPGQLRADQGAREGVHDLLPRPRGRHGGRLPGARPLPLLHLLGSRPRADVPDHRHLGRREPHLRHDQVRPLHAGRIAADAGRDPGHRRSPTRASTGSWNGAFDYLTLRGFGFDTTLQFWAFRASSSPSRSRCPCGRSTPGCPMRTSRRRRPAR